MTRTPAAGRHPEGRVHPRRRRDATIVVPARAALRGLADPRPVRGIPPPARSYAARRLAVVRAGRVPERRPRHDLDPLVRRADVRRRRAEDPDDLERHAGPRRRSGPASSRPGCSEATTAARRGATCRGCATIRAGPGWQPGAGGLICHTIVPHPTDAARMWVAISAVGTFATEDGGATWEARNRGVAAVRRAGSVPGDRPVRPQARHGRRRS